MHPPAPRPSRQIPRLRLAITLCVWLPLVAPGAPAQQSRESREPPVERRLPRQQAQAAAALDGVVRAENGSGAPVPGALLELRPEAGGPATRAYATAEGVFRIFPLAPGGYSLEVTAEGHAPLELPRVLLRANEVLTLDLTLLALPAGGSGSRLPRLPELGPPPGPDPGASSPAAYREIRHRLDSDPRYARDAEPEALPPPADVFSTLPDRWALEQPEYRR